MAYNSPNIFICIIIEQMLIERLDPFGISFAKTKYQQILLALRNREREMATVSS